jgi:hypothetical protein
MSPIERKAAASLALAGMFWIFMVIWHWLA